MSKVFIQFVVIGWDTQRNNWLITCIVRPSFGALKVVPLLSQHYILTGTTKFDFKFSFNNIKIIIRKFPYFSSAWLTFATSHWFSFVINLVHIYWRGFEWFSFASFNPVKIILEVRAGVTYMTLLAVINPNISLINML